MNGAHLHLLVNHVPVLGVIFGLLLLAAAIWRHSTELTRTSFVVFVLTAATAVVVYLTGEPAEDSVEGIAGVTKGMIGRHEDAALAATIGLGVLGVFSLAGLAGFRRVAAIPRWFASSALVLALAATGMMGWTANLGGQIRHTEIRAGAPAGGGDGEGGGNRHEGAGALRGDSVRAPDSSRSVAAAVRR